MAKTTIVTAGEANTAANVGTGSGVFKTKTGVSLQLRSIKAKSDRVSVDIESPDGNAILIDAEYENQYLDGICQTTDNIGDFVYVSGSGDPYIVTKADPRDTNKMPSIGVIVEKPTTTSCKIQWMGIVSGMYGSMNYGKPLFVALNGSMTQSPSTITPNVAGKAYVQNMGVALSGSAFLLKPNFSLIVKVDG